MATNTDSDPANSLHLVFSEVKNRQSYGRFILSVPIAEVEKKSLTSLKWRIIKNEHGKEWEDMFFCDAVGVIVDNNWTISHYLEHVNVGFKIPESRSDRTETQDDTAHVPSNPNGGGNSNGTNNSPQTPSTSKKDENATREPTDNMIVAEASFPWPGRRKPKPDPSNTVPKHPKSDNYYEVYLRKSEIKDEEIKSKPPNLDDKDPTEVEFLEPNELEALKSRIALSDWQARSGIRRSNAANLDEKHWDIITTNNALCYGFSIARQKKSDNEMTYAGTKRARYPAFQLKARKVKDTDEPQRDRRIPDFIIDDQSYVSIYETQTKFQSLLSEYSFSESDVSQSAGLSLFQIGGGESVSGGHSRTDKDATKNSEESSKMNISYVFPRVTVLLDKYCLELTEHCKKALEKVKDEHSMKAFVDLYGEYFSTEIQLGGRLYASEVIDKDTTGTAHEVKWSLRAQAATSLNAKIEGVGISGGMTVGGGGGRGTQDDKTRSHLKTTLQWQANGGDTLLCNNPPDWCSTVGPYENWRVTNRTGIYHLVDLMATFQGYESLKKFAHHSKHEHLEKVIKEKTTEHRNQNSRMFYLRDLVNWTYLTAYEEKQDVIMWNAVEDCNKYGGYLIFETMDGKAVTQITYGQPYVMRNPSSGLYIVPGEKNSKPCLVTADKPQEESKCLYIRAQDGREDTVAKQDDKVTMRIGSVTRDGSTILSQGTIDGYTHIICSSDSQDTEMVFQLMYKDVYEESHKGT